MAITRVRARVAVGRRQGTRVEGTRAPWIARRAAWTMSLAAQTAGARSAHGRWAGRGARVIILFVVLLAILAVILLLAIIVAVTLVTFAIFLVVLVAVLCVGRTSRDHRPRQLFTS
jgi:hypothetical protein